MNVHLTEKYRQHEEYLKKEETESSNEINKKYLKRGHNKKTNSKF